MSTMNPKDVAFCKVLAGLGLAGCGLGLIFVFSGQAKMMAGGALFALFCLWVALSCVAISSQPDGVIGWRKIFLPDFLEKYMRDQITRPIPTSQNKLDILKQIIIFSIVAGFIFGFGHIHYPVLSLISIVTLALIMRTFRHGK